MSFIFLLERYVGRRVCLSLWGDMKLWGRVASVHEDCLRLVDTSVSGDGDEEGWLNHLHADDESNFGARNPETVVDYNHITAVTCMDDDIVDVPVWDDDDEYYDEHDSGGRPRDAMLDALAVDRLQLKLGVGLMRMMDPQSSQLLARVRDARRKLTGDLGFVMPQVRVVDDFQLPQNGYCIVVDETPVAQGELKPGCCLALETPHVVEQIPGERAADPAGGQPARWIEDERRDRALVCGYKVLGPVDVLAHHLGHVARAHAHELLSVQQVIVLLEEAEGEDAAVVREVVPRIVPIFGVYHILCSLLEEGVPIKNLARILEGVGRRACFTDCMTELLAAARLAVRRRICELHRDERGRLWTITLHPRCERRLREQLEDARAEAAVALLAERLRPHWQTSQQNGRPVVLVVADALRFDLRRLLALRLPLPVLAASEVPGDLPTELEAVVSLSEETMGEESMSEDSTPDGLPKSSGGKAPPPRDVPKTRK